MVAVPDRVPAMTTKTTILAPVSVRTITIHVYPITPTSTMSASTRYRAVAHHRMVRKKSVTVTIIRRRRMAMTAIVVQPHACHQCHCGEHCSHISSPFIWRGLADYSVNCCDLFIKRKNKKFERNEKEKKKLEK